MRSRALVASFVAVGLVSLSPVGAAAQEQSEVAATALFDQGRNLMQQGKYAEACPKLAESERLAPSGGTLLNLADCYEHTGQTASAWAAWKDAAARANAAGKSDVEKRAVSRAAALEPNLAKLAISVDPASDVPGLEVKRDGVKVGHAEFGVPIPVDPGTHVIDATAPNKQPFSGKVDVAPKQANATLSVTLVDAPQAAPTPAPATTPAPTPATATAAPATPEQPASSWSGQKTVALIVGGVGLVGIGVGSAFGLIAKSKNDQALQNCRTSTLCSQTGLDLTNDAKSAATVSTVAFVAGGVLLAGGIVLWLTAPSSRSTTGLRFEPLVGTSLGGGAVSGSW